MEPRRIHSALRNRRWQVFTATVFLLLVFCWWGSHQIYQVVFYRFNTTSVLVEIAGGSFHFSTKNRGFECVRQPDGLSIDAAPTRSPVRYSLGDSSLSIGDVSISFLLAAIVFLAVQFLILPKSLPPDMK